MAEPQLIIAYNWKILSPKFSTEHFFSSSVKNGFFPHLILIFLFSSIWDNFRVVTHAKSFDLINLKTKKI